MADLAGLSVAAVSGRQAMTAAGLTPEERAREIVREWDDVPRDAFSNAHRPLIVAIATAIRAAVEAEREVCALVAEAAARSIDGAEEAYIREVAEGNAETIVNIVRKDARKDHLSAAAGLILHATVRARQIAGDRASAAIRSRSPAGKDKP